jgi:hypothetical protein
LRRVAPGRSPRHSGAMTDSSPAVADSIPLPRQSVRHRIGTVSIMPPEQCPPSLRNRVRHGPAHAFIDRKSLNVTKGVLDEGEGRNVLSWEVDMTGQIAKYRKSESPTTKLIADALQHYQSDGGLGVQIPTNNCIFIILSNKPLASDKEAKAKPKLSHGNAIRSRVEYRPNRRGT